MTIQFSLFVLIPANTGPQSSPSCGIIPEPLINICIPVREPPVIRGDQPPVTLLPGSLDQNQGSTQPRSEPFPLILPRQPRNDPGSAPVTVPDPDLIIQKIPHRKNGPSQKGGGRIQTASGNTRSDGIQIDHQISLLKILPDIGALSGKGGAVHDENLFPLRAAFISMIMRMALRTHDLDIIRIDRDLRIFQRLIGEMLPMVSDQPAGIGGEILPAAVTATVPLDDQHLSQLLPPLRSVKSLQFRGSRHACILSCLLPLILIQVSHQVREQLQCADLVRRSQLFSVKCAESNVLYLLDHLITGDSQFADDILP